MKWFVYQLPFKPQLDYVGFILMPNRNIHKIEVPLGDSAYWHVNQAAQMRELFVAALTCPWKPYGRGEKI